MFSPSELPPAEAQKSIEMYQAYRMAAKARGEHDVADYYQREIHKLKQELPTELPASERPKSIEMYQAYRIAAKARGEQDVADYYQREIDQLGTPGAASPALK
jgi:hypothetical protein